MIAVWMLYASAVGAFVSLAAVAGERLLRNWRLPVRYVWAVALAASVAVPVIAHVAPTAAARVEAGDAAVLSGVPMAAEAAATDPAPVGRIRASADAITAAIRARVGRLAAAAAPLDTTLAFAWGAGTLFLTLVLVHSARRLRRRSGQWQPRAVDGVPVLIAPDAGPAVVGARRLHVVIPDWMLGLDEPLRKLVLRHELEHIRAGDPQLLLAAILITIAMPWNPALWWQLRRLRTAVELDCDRRVLRVHRDVERYGLLLIAVGQRSGAPLRLGAPALAESTGSLQRRIALMTSPIPRRRERVVRALLLAPLVATLAAAACMMPSPNAVAGPEQVPPVEQRASAALDQHQPYFEFQVEKPVQQLSGGAPLYPAELRARGVSGTVIAQFVVDTNGVPEPDSFKVLESSHELFDEAIRAALPEMRFVAGEIAGRRVRQLVQQPFLFQLSGAQEAEVPTRVRTPAPPLAPTLAPLMRDGQRAPAPTRVPEGKSRVPLRTDELRPAMRAPAATGERQPAYFEYQVERPAALLPGGAPEYPPELRAQGVRGEVIVQFVVDATGRPDAATFQVLSSTHDRFSDAVRGALPAMRFTPAEIAGRAVPQLVQMPYAFGMR